MQGTTMKNLQILFKRYSAIWVNNQDWFKTTVVLAM
jgi:hypothetical protein